MGQTGWFTRLYRVLEAGSRYKELGYFDLITKHMENQRNTRLFKKCPEIHLKQQSFENLK